MPDQAVEVERGSCAGIGLYRLDLLDRHNRICKRQQGALGIFERGALRQVDDHLHFGLVVEGQEFDRHSAGDKEQQRQQRCNADGDQEYPCVLLRGHDRRSDAPVETAQAGFAPVRMSACSRRRTADDLHHQPGRNADGDEEREHHGRGGVCGYRGHVRPHQSGYEHHRKQRRDHGQRRDDCGIADFRYRVDGRFGAASPIIHRPVPGNVLDDDDGIINQNADREDQGEQADAVDRVAHHHRGKQRQQDRRRDDDQRHQRLTPANAEGDQDHDRDRRKSKMEQQFVGFVVCGRAIVAGHFHFHALGDQGALEGLESLEHRTRDHNGIGAGAFGNRDGDSGPRAERAGFAWLDRPDAGIGFGACHADIGHIAEINHTSARAADLQTLQLMHGVHAVAGLHDQRLAFLMGAARGQRRRSGSDALHEGLQRHPLRRQRLHIRLHPQFERAPADHIGEADILDLGEFVAQLVGEHPQGRIIPDIPGGGLR